MATARSFTDGSSIWNTDLGWVLRCARYAGELDASFVNLVRDGYHDANVRNLRVQRVQCDEIWAFVYGKDKNLTLEQVKAGAGSVWTWTAIDADMRTQAGNFVTFACSIGFIEPSRNRVSMYARTSS